MGDSQVWVLAGSTLLFIDIGSYGIKEWLAIAASVIGIGGSIFGLWRGWRYSKSQIVERLLEYLRDEESKIRDARNRIIRRLRGGELLVSEPSHDFYREVKDALDELASGDPQQAEGRLETFADHLGSDLKLGQKYLSNVNLQLATILLVRGRSAKDRSEATAARTAWESALQLYSEDAEAERYLGELALAGGDVKTARKHFARAYAFAPDDKILRAETWEQVAGHYQRQGLPKVELKALVECAPNFSGAGAHGRAAAAYARAGELGAQLNHIKQAPELWREAFENFRLSADHEGMSAIWQKLKDFGEDVSDLPKIDQLPGRHVPWFWIRLALEFSILGAAAGLIYLNLR